MRRPDRNRDTSNPSASSVIPESFAIDHTKMSAPQVRKAGVSYGPNGDAITKFDLRFMKPNSESLPTAALHTLEHLLATYMRCHLDIVDLSPMGCRTGFYLTVWGEVEAAVVQDALLESLKLVLRTEWSDVPGVSEKECGNFRDHSLFGAKEYAGKVLAGFGAGA